MKEVIDTKIIKLHLLLILMLMMLPSVHAQSLKTELACEKSNEEPVLNIVQDVTNDKITDVFNNIWAVANYKRHISVWNTHEDKIFCSQVSLSGKYIDLIGINSGGSISGDSKVVFSATEFPLYKSAFGFAGKFDMDNYSWQNDWWSNKLWLDGNFNGSYILDSTSDILFKK